MQLTVPDPVFHRAAREHAPGMVEVIHAAFGARPALDPPSTAIDETAETVSAAVGAGAGVYATVGGKPAGSLIIGAARTAGTATFQRVSVHPAFQQHGVASAMIAEAELIAAELGFDRVEIYARQELPELLGYWRHRGFRPVRQDAHGLWMARPLPIRVRVPDATQMRRLGERLADVTSAGDVIILSGALGAGKTTLTQGIGRGLDSDGPIISPTFVISRVHPSSTGRPTLVHVDAYRLGSATELEDLGLDADLDRAVTVIEWGEELAETLAESRLEIAIDRSDRHDRRDGRHDHLDGEHDHPDHDQLSGEHDHPDHDQPNDPVEWRTVWLDPIGARWDESARDRLRAAAGAPR